jgi:hypothetical protein
MASAAAFLLFTAVTVSAQAKPDFNGKWTMEMPAGAAAGGGGGGGGRGGGRGGGGGGGGFNCGMTCTITVTGTTLKVERMQGDQAVTNTFTIGGESKNAGRGGAEVATKTAWDGNKLVFTTTLDMQGTAVTATQTLSIEGGKLTVVRSSGREGATPTTQTYTKG